MKYWLLVLCLLLPMQAFADLDSDNVDDQVNSSFGCSTVISATAASAMGWIKVGGTPPTLNNICPNNSAMIRDTDRLIGLGRKTMTTYCFSTNDGGLKELTSTSSAGWHHLAWTLGGGTLSAYVDGVSVGSMAAGNTNCATGTLRMLDHMADRATGLMMFQATLSAGEVEAIAARRTHGPVRTMPAADWPLTDCADGATANGVSLVDRSGNGRNVTGSWGANGSGLICRASEYLHREWGAQ